MNRPFFTSVYLLVGCLTVAAFLLALGYARGALSARDLGVAFLMVIGLSFVLNHHRLTRLRAISLQGPNAQAQDTPAVAASVKRLRVAVIFLAVVFIVATFETRGAALFPRLVGAGVNIAFIGWFLFLIAKAKSAGK